MKNLDIDNQMLENIVKYAKNIEILDLTNCANLNSFIGKIIFENLKKLKTLILSGVNLVNDETLLELSNLINLKEIDLSLCKLITDEGLKHLANNKPNSICKINLSGLLRITNSGIKMLISKNLLSLNHLNLSILPQKFVDGSEFIDLICKCKNLQLLDISGMVNAQSDSMDMLTNSTFENLSHFNVSGINKINDTHIESLIQNYRVIEVIRASSCTLLSNSALDAILLNENEIKLKLFEINRTPLITDQKIEEVVKHFEPNFNVMRGTNLSWNLNNIGYRVPLKNIHFKKKDPKAKKGKKGGKGSKKKDDKNPIVQLEKMLEESKPKRIIDLFAVKKGKKGKKKKK